jgi:hypothetical protein
VHKVTALASLAAPSLKITNSSAGVLINATSGPSTVAFAAKICPPLDSEVLDLGVNIRGSVGHQDVLRRRAEGGQARLRVIGLLAPIHPSYFLPPVDHR